MVVTASNSQTGSGNFQPPDQPNAKLTFRRRSEKIDWRKIASIDVAKVTQNVDFQTLQENISHITFCNIEHELESDTTDPKFVKLFQISQLIIEYLLYSQDYLAAQLNKANEKQREQEEALDKLSLEKVKLKSDNRRRRQMLVEQQNLLLYGEPSANNTTAACNGTKYYQCPYCPKAFLTGNYLYSHCQRRHSDRPVPPLDRTEVQLAPPRFTLDGGTKMSGAASFAGGSKATEAESQVKEQQSSKIKESMEGSGSGSQGVGSVMKMAPNCDEIEDKDEWKKCEIDRHQKEMDSIRDMFCRELRQMHERNIQTERELERYRCCNGQKKSPQFVCCNKPNSCCEPGCGCSCRKQCPPVSCPPNDCDEFSQQCMKLDLAQRQQEEVCKLREQLQCQFDQVEDQLNCQLQEQERQWRAKLCQMQKEHADEIQRLTSCIEEATRCNGDNHVILVRTSEDSSPCCSPCPSPPRCTSSSKTSPFCSSSPDRCCFHKPPCPPWPPTIPTCPSPCHSQPRCESGSGTSSACQRCGCMRTPYMYSTTAGTGLVAARPSVYQTPCKPKFDLERNDEEDNKSGDLDAVVVENSELLDGMKEELEAAVDDKLERLGNIQSSKHSLTDYDLDRFLTTLQCEREKLSERYKNFVCLRKDCQSKLDKAVCAACPPVCRPATCTPNRFYELHDGLSSSDDCGQQQCRARRCYYPRVGRPCSPCCKRSRVCVDSSETDCDGEIETRIDKIMAESRYCPQAAGAGSGANADDPCAQFYGTDADHPANLSHTSLNGSTVPSHETLAKSTAPSYTSLQEDQLNDKGSKKNKKAKSSTDLLGLKGKLSAMSKVGKASSTYFKR